MNTLSYPSSSSGSSTPLGLYDVLLGLILVLLASFVFWTPPEFAASLPQDARDYAIPAVNLLERGRLVVSAYGHDFPPMHPPGMPLLLLPAYLLTGHFLGNGIYAILFCSVCTVALTYLIGVKLGGRLCGCSAALFLIWNYGFWQYSQKIMSEVPTTFLGILVLALLLTIRDRKRPGIVCLAVGSILGFAIVIHNDNFLLLVPAVMLLAWDTAGRERLERVGLVLVGMAPFLIGLAVYDQATFGSPWRTGYQYWGSLGSAKLPAFSAGYITRSGFMRLQGITNEDSSVEGNASLYIKSLLAQSDGSQLYRPPYWPLPVLRLYKTVALLRTALGAVGLLACLAAWRTNLVRQRFLLWTVVITFASLGIFSMFYYRDERFLVRLLAPVFCLANGVGVAALFAKWPSKSARVAVLVAVGALIRWFMVVTPVMGLPMQEPQGVYEGLTWVASRIETNAVVVSNFDPLCLDAYIIHGTHRMAVPLEDKEAILVFIGRDLTPTSFSPFVASRDPERLRELLHSGAPVYWLFHASWWHMQRTPEPSTSDLHIALSSLARQPELSTLGRSFRLEALSGVRFQGKGGWLFFGRIDDVPRIE